MEKRKRRKKWVNFDRAAFVFGREHVSFTYFVFVSEFF